MFLVDSSVWITFIRNRVTIPRNPESFTRFVTCGPVLQEVLQGLGPGPANRQFREAMLALPCIGDPLSQAAFLSAAEIYRNGRARGFTIRSSYDCLIAAIAIERNVTVWHQDRDYDAIASYTLLQATSRAVP
jgi:predicted nucleic acid-binding protein